MHFSKSVSGLVNGEVEEVNLKDVYTGHKMPPVTGVSVRGNYLVLHGTDNVLHIIDWMNPEQRPNQARPRLKLAGGYQDAT